MAAVAEAESETRLCSNCQKEIPLANFTMHEIHCSRNIGVCHICKESFPKSEMKSHQELEHTQVTCKCSLKVDSGLLQEHMALACPLRRVACQHCDLELAFSRLQEHEDYCGARTERCVRCRRNVMLKDLKAHPEDCGERAEEARVARAKPGLNSGAAALHNLQAIRSLLQAGDALPGTGRGLEGSRLHNCLSGDRPPKEPNRRSLTPAQPVRNPGALERGTSTQPLTAQEPGSDLDYLLAVSLQRENSSRERSAAEIQRELWEDIRPTRTRPAGEGLEGRGSGLLPPGFSASSPSQQNPEALLPCEFCEELYPEEDLILHQTGCNPARALASFSKWSSPVPRPDRHEYLMDLWEQLQSRRATGPREPLPLQQEVGGSLMLPCEFCGVQLEEEILFHHQDQCDLRPATASLSGRSPSQQGAPERAEAPGLPQGEALPLFREEEFRQPQPPQPGPGSRFQGSPPATDQAQLISSGSRRGNSAGERPGRGPRWGSTSHTSTALPARHSPLAFPPSSYVPSFPVTAPTRPSMRSEGQRGPRPAPGHSTQVPPWRAGLADPGPE